MSPKSVTAATRTDGSTGPPGGCGHGQREPAKDYDRHFHGWALAGPVAVARLKELP